MAQLTGTNNPWPWTIPARQIPEKRALIHLPPMVEKDLGRLAGKSAFSERFTQGLPGNPAVLSGIR